MISLLALAEVVAQQLPQGGLYTLNPFVVNPALSGAYDFADVRLSYRRQWQGLDDAPQTAYLSAHTPLGYGEPVTATARTPRYSGGSHRSSPSAPVGAWRWGGGAVLLADQTGPTERNVAQLTAAGHVTLPGQWQLSAGLGAGMLQYMMRFDRIQTASPSDPILPDGRVSLLKPFISLGMMARRGNFWAGASVLSPNAISLAYTMPSGETSARLLPHYLLTAAYRLDISEEWAVFPQAWLKNVLGTPLSVDGQMRVQYADRLWGGVHYRVGDSMGALLGMILSPNLSLSYSYEYPISSLRSASVGSHEILLGFRFNNRAAIYCPPMGW